MKPSSLIWIVLAVGLSACRSSDGHEVSASRTVTARPALVDGSQTALAKELDDAERRGTWTEVRHRWQNQRLHWTVTRQRSLCGAPDACNVAAFPIQRPAQQGWLPGMQFSQSEFTKLEAGCGTAEQCELEVEGTLSDLEASPEMPTAIRFSDVHVIAAKPV